MKHYCDSTQLERVWFQWYVAKSLPQLEPYRRLGWLWTKTGDGNRNPRYPIRHHILSLDIPFYFESSLGVVSTQGLPLDLDPDSQFRSLGFVSRDCSHLTEVGFYQELPTRSLWNQLLEQIAAICRGIAFKLRLPNEDDRSDIAADALIQVVGKLQRDKLVFEPGRAPVFNLLTTTIHRCMFSTLSKRNRQAQKLSQFVEEVASSHRLGSQSSPSYPSVVRF